MRVIYWCEDVHRHDCEISCIRISGENNINVNYVWILLQRKQNKKYLKAFFAIDLFNLHSVQLIFAFLRFNGTKQIDSDFNIVTMLTTQLKKIHYWKALIKLLSFQRLRASKLIALIWNAVPEHVIIVLPRIIFKTFANRVIVVLFVVKKKTRTLAPCTHTSFSFFLGSY